MFPFGDCGRPRRCGRRSRSLALALVSLTLPLRRGVAAPSGEADNTARARRRRKSGAGTTLSASRGRWAGRGRSPTRSAGCAAGRTADARTGATAASSSAPRARSYQVASADVGSRLRVRVTATNAEGEQTVASNPTAVVVGPPVNTSIPLVGGTALVGSLATVAARELDRPAADLLLVRLAALQQRGRRVRRRSARWVGATASPSSDVNHKIRVNVTATKRGRLRRPCSRRVGGRERPAPRRER